MASSINDTAEFYPFQKDADLLERNAQISLENPLMQEKNILVIDTIEHYGQSSTLI